MSNIIKRSGRNHGAGILTGLFTSALTAGYIVNLGATSPPVLADRQGHVSPIVQNTIYNPPVNLGLAFAFATLFGVGIYRVSSYGFAAIAQNAKEKAPANNPNS